MMNDGRRFLGMLLALVLFATGQGCGSAPMEGDFQPDDDEIVDDPGALDLEVAGLPAGTDADVTVTSPDGRERSFTAGAVLEPLEPGDYVVTAAAVLGSDGFGYRPDPASQTVFVEAGVTTDARVAYEPSSGSLLVAVNGLSPAAEADLTVTGPNGFRVDLVEQSIVLTDLEPGSYTVEMRDVSSDDADFVAQAPLSESVFVNEGFAETINMSYLCARVYIGDPEVEAQLRGVTGKAAGDFDCEDLAEVTHLYLTDGATIAGLQHLRNLESLSIAAGNPEDGIEDLEPLRHLTTLVELRLTHHKLSDLEPLTGLENLEVLHIERNLTPLEDLAPLRSLPSLTELHLVDVGLVAAAIEPLGQLIQLEDLRLDFNPLAGVAALAPLVNLKKLGIQACEVTDIGPLAEMTDLLQLFMRANPIGDLTPIAGMAQLETLSLREIPVSDLEPVGKLTSLESLDARGTPVSDLSPLASCPNLARLDVTYTDISSLDEVAKLRSLTELSAGGNQLKDLGPLSELHGLQALKLINNAIDDLSPLKTLAALETLWVDSNAISDLTHVTDLKALRSLGLAYNFLEDISPLLEDELLDELNEVNLSCNNLDLSSGSETVTHITRLRQAGVHVEEGLQRPDCN